MEIAAREAAIDESTLATIIYTSGTTGNPKGVMLTHGNLLCNAKSTCDISFVSMDDVLMSWLPYSHIYARTVDHYLTSIGGLTVVLAESVDTLMENIKQIQPTWLTAVPRVYEKVWNAVATLDQEAPQLRAAHDFWFTHQTVVIRRCSPAPLHRGRFFRSRDPAARRLRTDRNFSGHRV